MNRPMLAANVERRLLVNYRADPDVVARLLPPGLRPQLVDGWSVAGICLIRLGRLRPAGWPHRLGGLRSENAAHRVAVEWDGADGPASGVFVVHRHSDGLANLAVGGRLYPGVHHRARFDVAETPARLRVAFRSRDGATEVEVDARPSVELGGTLFAGLAEASRFFEAGSVGLSPGRRAGALDGLELRTDRWAVEPVAVERARSSFFDDASRFPPGSIELDCALAMRDVPVTWSSVAPTVRRSAPAATG